MFFRSRRRRDGWVVLFRRSVSGHPARAVRLLDATEFAIAIEKERSRSDRRDLCFSIVRIEFKDTAFLDKANQSKQHSLVVAFRDRLRITDEIGEFENTMAVLLPETYPSQAALVTNDLTQLALSLNIQMTTDIVAYPEVDSNDDTNGKTRSLARHDGSHTSIRHDSSRNGNGKIVSQSKVAGSEEANSFSNSTFDSAGGVATLDRKTSRTITKTSDVAPASVKATRLPTTVPTPKWKRALDIFGASCGMLVLSPVFAAAIIAVRCTSRGPAFFLQWREGKDGQLFLIYKFRTMRLGADDEKDNFRDQSEQDGPAFKIKDDPRITWVGRYLRKSCIDELPQLINVLKGEMSLVGPRPLPVDESLNCTRWHRRRLDVLPGMTCIWQVDGGRDIPFDEWMRMDLEYVKKRSFFADVKLIVKTAFVTLLHRGSV